MTHPVVPITVIFVASIICFGTASTNFNSNSSSSAWAVAAGVLSCVVAGILLFMHTKLSESGLTKKVPPFVGAFLVVWWVFGVGFTTGITDIFGQAGNGFFSVWACLICSLWYVTMTTAISFKALESVQWYAGVTFALLASLVVLGTTADACTSVSTLCSNNTANIAYGLAVGVISTVVCIALLCCHVFIGESLSSHVYMGFGAFLTIWWMFATGFLTSTGNVFQGLGNGYFATWSGFIASGYYFVHQVPFIREEINKNLQKYGPKSDPKEAATTQWNAEVPPLNEGPKPVDTPAVGGDSDATGTV